jgi:hypothetical protein
MTSSGSSLSVVEVRLEVLFLFEVLEEFRDGKLRIPRFQRPFIWRRHQMTDLLDSVYKQYPIGNILVWDTDIPVATLPRLGPLIFPFPDRPPTANVGYVLDGHQRLSTLAGALMPRSNHTVADDDDPGRWNLVWNMDAEQFEHGISQDSPDVLFPLTALLDTLEFFHVIDVVRGSLAYNQSLADHRVSSVSQLAKAFQQYRVPVVRIDGLASRKPLRYLLGSTRKAKL